MNNDEENRCALGASRLSVKFDAAVVDDLADLVRRLAHSLRRAKPDNDLPEKALDYLRRMGLQRSPLR